MKKTNAARILKQHAISFEMLEYEVDENDLSAENVAQKVGRPIEMVFKTLLLRGDKTGELVTVIPGHKEVDLKAIASASKNKKCHMVPLKEVLPLTGYIRGGVSPIGMKKYFPTFVDRSALEFDKICVSAGMRGLQLELSPHDLISVAHAMVDQITA